MKPTHFRKSPDPCAFCQYLLAVDSLDVRPRCVWHEFDFEFESVYLFYCDDFCERDEEDK